MKTKSPQIPRSRRVLVPLLTGAVACLTAAVFLLVQNGILDTVVSLWRDGLSGEPSDNAVVTPPLPDDAPEVPAPVDPVFARPDAMRGVWVTAGVDYRLTAGDSDDTIRSQLDAVLEAVVQWKFNTLLVPLDSSPAGEGFDPIAYLLQEGRKQGLYIYGVLDLGLRTEGASDPATTAGMTALLETAGATAAAYAFDGYLLDNVGYAYGKPGSRAEYDALSETERAGLSFEQYLRDRVTQAVSSVVALLKDGDINRYVGLLADAVWAHASVQEGGSDTRNVYEAFTDGYADTRTWVEQGLFDFVMLKDYTATTNTSAAFGTVLTWWSDLCGMAGVPLYVSHAASEAMRSGAGWDASDQLAQQVLLCQKAAAWQGSVFHSAAALIANAGGLTDALLRAFDNTLDEEYITRQLTFTSPEKTSFTTHESTLSFRGSADPNFPLTLNGEEVTLTDHGFFTLDLPLQSGANSFVFAHKGQTVTYTATYSLVIIQSVGPAGDLSLEGGTTINISATARKGASLSASVGGTAVSMKEAPLQSEDGTNEESDYVNFAGEYTLPAGIVGQGQSLGRVQVTGRYQGASETKTGGSLRVKPLPAPEPSTPSDPSVPADPSDPSSSNPGSSEPSDPSGGGAVLATGTVVTINRAYAETFSGNTTDDWSRPVNAYLPYGTTDVIVKNVYDSASGSYYYLLGCGRRVYQSNVKVYQKNGQLTANTLTAGNVTVSDGYTHIALSSTWHIPYNLRLLPQAYGNEATQNYNITALTTQYVDITFYYTTSKSGTPDVSASPLFRSAEWVAGGTNAPTLRLYLRSTGAMRGYSVAWKDGQIVFSFRNPAGAAGGSQPLSGKRIVIDPGHGGSSTGTASGSAVEKNLTLQYGLMLRDKLQALGATVVMTRTTDILPDASLSPASMDARTAYARNNSTDLFISLHMDSAGSSARGFTVFYFNEYAMPFAKAVAARADTAYRSVGGQSNRSTNYKWGNFHVMRLHDCPSILVECGFMSNAKDLELLISERYRDALTTALANGMVDYYGTVPAAAMAAYSVAPPSSVALPVARREETVGPMPA